MNYWQIASGDSGRNYAPVFYRYGIALAGGNKNVARITKVRPGDRIVLKSGYSRLLAVGIAIERDGICSGKDDKAWTRDFDGWDLRGYCCVEWHVLPEPRKVSGLTQSAINKVNVPEIRALVDQLLTELPSKEALPEPGPIRHIDDTEILTSLMKQGMRAGAAQELTDAFNRVRLLTRYYYTNCPWESIHEFETQTFLVVPLLLGLGWSEQQLKIDLPIKGRQRVDIACFSVPQPGARSDDCSLIIETKTFCYGLQYAPAQAERYARVFPKCNRFAVTNGFCYRLYERGYDGSFMETPSAYLNIVGPTEGFPLDPQNVPGCLEALRLLRP